MQLPYGTFTPRTELDYYGFSFSLSRILDVKRRYYSFAGWMHGWKYWEINSDFGIAGGPREKRHQVDIFVPNDRVKTSLCKLGYKRVHIGVAPWAAWALDPFVNLGKKPLQMERKILGVLPKKPSEDKLHYQFNSYLEFLIDTFKSNELTVLISSANRNASSAIDALKKSRISYVVGPAPNEINGLNRLAYIMSNFDYVISGYIGTHLGIASLAGAKIGIVGPYVEPVDKYNPWYADYEDVVNEQYVRRTHPMLFVSQIESCDRHYDFFVREAGLNTQLDKNKILTILGWNTVGIARRAYLHVKKVFL